MTQRAALRPSLRERRFVLLVGGQMINSVGSWATAIALWGFATYSFDASAYAVSVLTLCWAAPVPVLAPVAGVYVDRLGPRRTLVLGYLLSAASAVGLAFADGLFRLEVAALLYGVTRSVTGPASSALMPHIVEADDLLTANARVAAAGVVGQIAGPVMASVILVVGSFRGVFVFDAVTYLAGAFVIWLLPHRAVLGQQRSLWHRELTDAVRTAGRSRTVRRLVLLGLAVTFTSGAFLVVEPLYARHVLHRPPSQFALFEAATGVGALVTSLLIPSARRRLANRRVLGVAAAAYGGLALVFVGTRVVAVAYAGAFAWGAAGAVFSVVTATALQSAIPKHLLGRVSGGIGSLQAAVDIASLPVAGAAITATSIQVGAAMASGVAIVVGGLAAARPWHDRADGRDPTLRPG